MSAAAALATILVIFIANKEATVAAQSIALPWPTPTASRLLPPAAPTSQPMCPCIAATTGGPRASCLPYDVRYQANTIQEALTTFLDLTMDKADQHKARQETRRDPTCMTKACKKCREMLEKRLTQLGLISDLSTPMPPIWVVDSNATAPTCDKYRFARRDPGVVEPPAPPKKGTAGSNKKKPTSSSDETAESVRPLSDDAKKKLRRSTTVTTSQEQMTTVSGEGDNFVKAAVNAAEANKDDDASDETARHAPNPDDDDDDDDDGEHAHKRGRRQAVSQLMPSGTGPPLVGQRYIISCTTRGVTQDSFGSVSLCNTCWAWRQLPSGYEPQYVNEIVCDEASTVCLSGYGTCQSYARSMTVQVNGVTMNLEVGAYCQCRCQAASPVISLVAGSQTPASLSSPPPL